MSDRPKSSEMALQCTSLFENIEDLRWDDMKSAIESAIFSEPLGSHKALHFFLEVLRNNNTRPLIKLAIFTTFRSPSLRRKIEVDWNLFRDYDHAKTGQHIIDAPHDLASWSIEHCHSCFNGLLDHDIVRPSSFCQNGYSFFWLALRSEQYDLMKRIVSLMDSKDLLNPFSMREPEKDRYTIFQVSTWNRRWFAVCWARLKSLPNNGTASLGLHEMENIFGFADVDLANELFEAGLDLGKPHLDNASPGWLKIVHRADPEPMLTWLLSRGHQPPEKFLTYAAAYDSIPTAKWIMPHSQYTHDWREAIYVAAESTSYRSAELMTIILRGSATKQTADATMAQNLVIRIVDGVCKEIKNQDVFSFSSDDDFRKTIEDMEHGAIEKIKSLGEVIGGVNVIGTKIIATKAGFHQLSSALEALGNKDLPA